MVKDILRELEKKMKVSAEHFRRDLSKLRTGRANLGLFEDLTELKSFLKELVRVEHHHLIKYFQGNLQRTGIGLSNNNLQL